MKRILVALVALSLLAVGVLAFGVHQSQSAEHTPVVSIGGTLVSVSIMRTHEERQKGLSGTAGLAPDEGMLFVFPQEGVYSFWMKDMLFPIDIVWISRVGTIVHIESNVSPATYPATYASTEPALFVLELPAGFTSAHNVRIGDRVGL